MSAGEGQTEFERLLALRQAMELRRAMRSPSVTMPVSFRRLPGTRPDEAPATGDGNGDSGPAPRPVNPFRRPEPRSNGTPPNGPRPESAGETATRNDAAPKTDVAARNTAAAEAAQRRPRHRRAGEADDSAARPEDDQRLLRESLDIVGTGAAEVIDHFYTRLFDDRPDLPKTFGVAMRAQRDRLFRALVALVDGLHRPDLLTSVLHQLGRDHRKFGVEPGHYETAGRALIGALREQCGGRWRPEFEGAWLRAYELAAQIMVDGAEQAEGSPVTWSATVVGHVRRHDTIAVIRVLPDDPYPYLAGQYAAIEHPRRPGVWRPYSMATAPAESNVLEFHVRALGTDGVSDALVGQADIGDVLHLGPPTGSTVHDPSGRDVLLIGGGTGLAPVRALAEEIVTDPDRHATLLFAARTRPELYDLEALYALADRAPGLTLIVAVAEDADFPGVRGTPPDVVAEYGAWTDHDVYVAGPPNMMTATLDRLATLGVPTARVRYDIFT